MTEHRLRRLDTGEEFALAGQMFIGRDDDCEISLEDPEVSRRHSGVIGATALEKTQLGLADPNNLPMG